MMLPFLPPLYPDELLYSFLARIHWLTCSESPTLTMEELFGDRHISAGVALQTNLADLCKHFPLQRELTPEKLMNDATLFPYLTFFQSKKIRKWAFAKLVKGKAGDVHIRLGLVAGVVKLPIYMRYCPKCRLEMLAEQRELYWMRSHQLPGVLVCPFHRGVPLMNSTVCPAEQNRQEYVAADEINCSVDSHDPDWINNSDAINLLNVIAEESINLLKTPSHIHRDEPWWEYYRKELVKRGFGKGISNINQKLLYASYIAYFKPIFSILPESAPGQWLKGMVYAHNRAMAPLWHILFRLLLNTAPVIERYDPFGGGPWRCRNPLADHYGQLVICSCSTHREGGKIIGVFRCSCGYAFSQAENSDGKIRILNLGPAFDVKLKELLSAGAGLRASARALSVDCNTVLRYISKLGLNSSWKQRAQRTKPIVLDRDSIRRRWLSATEISPKKSRKQLRLYMPAEYAWLYRNDNEWLKLHLPEIRPACQKKQKYDWATIDAKLSEELRKSIEKLRKESPPRPITLASLCRAIGKPKWLYKRLQKLPLCTKTLIDYQESADEYYRRRISWAIMELRLRGDPLKTWKIRDLAGAPNRCCQDIEDMLRGEEGMVHDNKITHER